MKASNVILFLSVLIVGLSSCSRSYSPFTQKLYDTNRWSESDLKSIQFYLSDDIVLRRQVSNGSSEIISGEIKMVDGKQVEEVFIKKGTPGVLIFVPKENRLAVSFEDKGDRRFLMFGPNPKQGGRYTLRAKEWKRRRGKVTYEDKTYYTEGESAYAALMVDLKKVRKVSVSSRKAGGRKID